MLYVLRDGDGAKFDIFEIIRKARIFGMEALRQPLPAYQPKNVHCTTHKTKNFTHLMNITNERFYQSHKLYAKRY